MRRLLITLLLVFVWDWQDAKIIIRNSADPDNLPPVVVQPPPSTGTIRVAASCNRTDVLAAMALAVDGDTVQMPAGTCTWTASVSISNKSITLRGAGVDVTTILYGVADMAASGSMLNWSLKSAGVSRLTGLSIDSGTGGTSGQNAMLWFSGNTASLVVDHVKLTQRRHEGVRVTGNVRGVFSAITATQNSFGAMFRIEHNSWGGVGTTCSSYNGCGDNSWAQPSSIGTAEALYIEASTITCTFASYCFAIDGWHGSRVAYRFNTVNNTQIGNHGTESAGRPRGARQYEYYGNTATNSLWDGVSPLATRGGTGIVFDNVVSGRWSGVFDMSTYRSLPTSQSESFYPWGDAGQKAISQITCSGGIATVTATAHALRVGDWTQITGSSIAGYNGIKAVLSPPGPGGRSLTTFTFAATCAGTASNGGMVLFSPFDGNVNSSGYRAMDQIGAGPGVLLQGDESVSNFGFGILTPVPVNQTLDPVYIWNNLRLGVLTPGILANASAAVVSENRDFYNQNDTACAPSASNCFFGVGRGTLAQRPAGCTAGVGYWATDVGEWNTTNGATPDGQLYTCVSPNTWALRYKPYTYPHPLTVGN